MSWLRRLAVPLGLLAAALLLLAVLGVRGRYFEDRPIDIFPDQKFQPRLRAQGESRFFADGAAARSLVAGTVPFGGLDYASDAGAPALSPALLQAEDELYRGKQAGTDQWVTEFPVRLTPALLERGRERFAIHCQVCHGVAGYGNGITAEYGWAGIANYHSDKYRQMPVGELYNVVCNGKGTMQGYAPQIGVEDRWAIVAWVRVLQRSQNAAIGDVPEPFRGKLERER